jgi:hypothetical protein
MAGCLATLLTIGCSAKRYFMYYTDSKTELNALKKTLEERGEKIVDIQYSKEVNIYSVKTKK